MVCVVGGCAVGNSTTSGSRIARYQVLQYQVVVQSTALHYHYTTLTKNQDKRTHIKYVCGLWGVCVLIYTKGVSWMTYTGTSARVHRTQYLGYSKHCVQQESTRFCKTAATVFSLLVLRSRSCNNDCQQTPCCCCCGSNLFALSFLP
jgi:hypothetical protein